MVLSMDLNTDTECIAIVGFDLWQGEIILIVFGFVLFYYGSMVNLMCGCSGVGVVLIL